MALTCSVRRKLNAQSLRAHHPHVAVDLACSPAIEVPVNSDNFQLSLLTAESEGWRNVAHPDIVNRRLDDYCFLSSVHFRV
jgi:hypothetical protein